MAYLVKTLATLRAQYDAAHPGRSKSHDGWIGDTAHSKRKSDHNPDMLGRVKAVDITASGAAGRALADSALRTMLRRGQKGYVIHAGRIANPSVSGGAWRKYNGSNPHTHHVHVSAHSLLNSTQGWLFTGAAVVKEAPLAVTGKLDPATVKAVQRDVGVTVDGDMGPQTIKAVQRRLIAAGFKLPRFGADGDMGAETARALEARFKLPATNVSGLYPGILRAMQRLYMSGGKL